MDNVKTPNTEGLVTYARNKKDIILKKVDAAIKKLIKEKGRINFNSVSMESGVSKAYCITIKESVKELKHYESNKKVYLPRSKKKTP